MKWTSNTAKYLALCSAVILIVACANQMEPAKNALDNINATLAAASADAQQYVPDQLASAQSKAAALTVAFEKKDYAAVVAGLLQHWPKPMVWQALPRPRRTRFSGRWVMNGGGLAASIPQSVTAVQTRIDALSKTKHVPKGVDLSAAKSALADATSAWEKAQSAFKSGNPSDAVIGARDAKSKVDSAAAALKLNLPQAA